MRVSGQKLEVWAGPLDSDDAEDLGPIEIKLDQLDHRYK
jgi:hypothetical protein